MYNFVNRRNPCVLPLLCKVTPVITYIQSTDGGSSGNTTNFNINLSWGSTTTAGSLLVAVIAFSGKFTTFGGVPSGWSTAVTQSSGNNSSVIIAYKANAVSQTSTGSFSFLVSSNIGAAEIGIAEFANLAASSPLDQTASQTNSGTGPVTGTTSTLAHAIELAIGGFQQSGASGSWSSPFDGTILQSDSTNTGMCMMYAILSSVTGIEMGVNYSAGGSGAGAIATFHM